MYYYKLINDPNNIYITEKPYNALGYIEITEDEYNELLIARAESANDINDFSSIMNI